MGMGVLEVAFLKILNLCTGKKRFETNMKLGSVKFSKGMEYRKNMKLLACLTLARTMRSRNKGKRTISKAPQQKTELCFGPTTDYKTRKTGAEKTRVPRVEHQRKTIEKARIKSN